MMAHCRESYIDKSELIEQKYLGSKYKTCTPRQGSGKDAGWMQRNWVLFSFFIHSRGTAAVVSPSFLNAIQSSAASELIVIYSIFVSSAPHGTGDSSASTI